MSRFLFVLPVFAIGCVSDTYDYDYDYGYSDEYYDVSYEDSGVSVEGVMAGHMAANGDFDRDVTSGSASRTSFDSAFVEIHSLGDAWAMFGAELPLDRMTRDSTYTFAGDEILTVGCSGPLEYEYAFDGPAIETQVTVTDLEDGSVQVAIWAEFSGADHIDAVVVVPPIE